jgi:arginyl-tRNA synthetase
MKELILDLLKDAFKELNVKLKDEEILSMLEVPKDSSNGDYSFPCFILSKIIRENPHEIAIDIVSRIGTPPEEIEDIQSVGPYVNFFINKKLESISLINKVKKEKDNFGKLKKSNKTIMVEFPSPNTNKPLHLGHLRNMSIGESISRISEANGFKVKRVNLNNDRGIAICKSMAAYIEYATNDKPTKTRKGDHLVGDFYVKFNKESEKNPELEILSHRLLQKWEEGDKEVRRLWKDMNRWALDGFKETYKKFGIKFDKEYFESEIYKKGKDIILDGLKKGVFKKGKAGEIKIDLKKQKLGSKVLLRADGTSLYMTQDIYLAKKKFEDYDLEESIYVTGNEQEYHFKVLFYILDKLNIADKNKLKHLSYGMVNLPDGRMKSREGTVVDADDLIDNLQELVKKELKKRNKLSKKELEKRSLKIALAAIKYFLLKVDVKKDMAFNPRESISFDGDTGPYILYSYARASSILKKINKKPQLLIPENLEKKEKELIQQLLKYNKIVKDSYEQMNPALVANYSYKLAQIFNEFYHECPVMNSESESFRLHLVKTFRQVLKNSLDLLGIETIEEM